MKVRICTWRAFHNKEIKFYDSRRVFGGIWEYVPNEEVQRVRTLSVGGTSL